MLITIIEGEGESPPISKASWFHSFHVICLQALTEHVTSTCQAQTICHSHLFKHVKPKFLLILIFNHKTGHPHVAHVTNQLFFELTKFCIQITSTKNAHENQIL